MGEPTEDKLRRKEAQHYEAAGEVGYSQDAQNARRDPGLQGLLTVHYLERMSQALEAQTKALVAVLRHLTGGEQAAPEPPAEEPAPEG